LLKNLIKFLIILILKNNAYAEQATSGNLLPNAGVGTTNLQNSSGNVDGINGSNGWTTSGISNFNNELEANGTGTVSSNGSLVGITTEKQNGGQFTTTADSLDGGIRLDSTTEVQNCEWSGSAHQCGQATNGRDSYSTTVNILDSNNNSLATVTQNRNNDAGYYGNTYTYTDTIIHNGTGARNWDWTWTGIDGNDINSTSPVAPNLLGAELTATLLDINYSPLPPAIQTELTSFNEEISEEFKEFEKILKFEEEIKLEEVFTFEKIEEEPKLQEPKMEKLEQPMMTQKEEKPEPVTTQKEEIGGQSVTSAQNTTQEQEVRQEEEMVQSITEEKETESTSQVSNEPDKTGNATSDKKDSVSVSLEKTMAKIDAKIKDIDKNLKIKNYVKIKAMLADNILLNYNVPFYKDKRIYEDQINIRDNRVLYSNASLVSYIQNDPIIQKETQIQKIRQKKEKLLREIEVLKNG